MSIPLRVLILEDQPDDAELMLDELRRAGFDPEWRRVETESDYMAQLDPKLDMILADYVLPRFNARRALERLQECAFEIPFIVVSGAISEDVALDCLKRGAADYLLKDRLGRLGMAVMSVLEQRRLVEEKRQTEAALQEKELLLKEIHHRVKNNLQVISSLLSLQAGYIEDPRSRQLFSDSQHRVKSMALIHEKLYQSKNLAGIDLAEYIRCLADDLIRSYGVDSERIALEINAEEVFLKVDAAIPCGLLLHELLSNCLKHAFPGGRPGAIRIDLWSNPEGHLCLLVRDNGVGLPEELDFLNTDSLGLQLVKMLAEQLDGTIELVRDTGTVFRITFAGLKYQKGS